MHSEQEEAKRGAIKATADTVEALLGAIYVDQGPKAAREFVSRHVLSKYDDIDSAVKFQRPKHALAELCAQKKLAVPTYKYVWRGCRCHSFVFCLFGVVVVCGETYAYMLRTEFWRRQAEIHTHPFSKWECLPMQSCWARVCLLSVISSSGVVTHLCVRL